MTSATEINKDEASRMIGFALDVIHQDLVHDPQFRISIEPLPVSNRYTIQFTNKDDERMMVGFELKAYEPLTIPSETLATIALILS